MSLEIAAGLVLSVDVLGAVLGVLCLWLRARDSAGVRQAFKQSRKGVQP